MAKSQLDQLRELDSECRQICLAAGGDGSEYKLLYSHAATFNGQATYMFLGTNPGGDPPEGKAIELANSYQRRVFERGPWSSYIDEQWWTLNTGRASQRLLPAGSHRMQFNVRSLAHLLSGDVDGTALLRSSPAGNLWPFRSRLSSNLDGIRQRHGWSISRRLIEMADPEVIVLLMSDQKRWKQVMDLLGHAPTADHREPAVGAGYNRDYLEANVAPGTGRTRLVIALPAFNNLNTDPGPALRVLKRRIAEGHVPASLK